MACLMLAGLLPFQGLLGGALTPSRGSLAVSASRSAVDMKVFDWKVRDAPPRSWRLSRLDP